MLSTDRILAYRILVDQLQTQGVPDPKTSAADQLGIPRSTARRWKMEGRLGPLTDGDREVAAKKGLLGFDPVLPGFEVTKVKTQKDGTGQTKGHSITQEARSARKPFEIPDGFELAKGTVHVKDNVVVEHWPRYAPANRDPKMVAEEFIQALSGRLPPILIKPSPAHALDNLLTVYPIVDWHVGLLAWGEETGGENWDTSIAKDTILQAMVDVMSLTKPSKRCVLLNTGDMMHFDGYEPKTSRSGHVLDTDTRYPKIRRTAVSMFDTVIQLALEKHEFVEVVSLPGNHDDQSAGWIALALDMKYRDHPRVDIDTGSSRMWWRRHDKLFLGGNHRDMIKPKELPMVMAVDRPEDWAASSRKVIYTGHVHHEETIEIGGVRVLTLRTPTAKDAYNSWHHWRSGRSVYADTYSLDGRYSTRETMDL